MVCFLTKPMTSCGVSAPKNKFLRIPTAHRHHWRGYPYIIYIIDFSRFLLWQAPKGDDASRRNMLRIQNIIASDTKIFFWQLVFLNTCGQVEKIVGDYSVE